MTPANPENKNKPKITKCKKTDPPNMPILIPKQLSKFKKTKNQTKK